MKNLTIMMKRLVLTFLVFIALMTTFQSISGVGIQSVSAAISQKVNSDDKSNYLDHTVKKIKIAFKSLQRAVQTETQISSSKAVVGEAPTLEEAFDWSQYPIKQVVATGYTAGYESTGKSPNHPEFGITYSGVKVKRDLYSTVAADLNVFPIGTILFIPGYGYGVVADKGGAIKGNRLDLYYETVDDVYNQWGKKTIDVYVVKIGNGALTESELATLNEAESMQVFRQQYMNTGRN